MENLPGDTMKQLREVAAIAHERELSRVLEKLARDFDEWKAGRISSNELDSRIQQYQKPAKELFNTYNTAPVETLVAHGIARGILLEDELEAPVLESIRNEIGFYRDRMQEEED